MFGGSPCSNEFCLASELCTDLANDILHCPEWGPSETTSSHATRLGKTIYSKQDIPCAIAKRIRHYHSPRWLGLSRWFCRWWDSYCSWFERKFKESNTSFTVSNSYFVLTFRQTRAHPTRGLSIPKETRGGALSVWNSNNSGVGNKYKSQELADAISSKKISFKDLERLLGRLNHAVYYFLNRIRKMLQYLEDKLQLKMVTLYLQPSTWRLETLASPFLT